MELLLQDEETAVALFQDYLGALDPALGALLTTGVAGSERDLLAVLSLGIRGLNAPETVIPALKATGRDHARQGIQSHHYQSIGEAMLWAVAQLQGDDFDAAVAGAWAEAFYLIAGLMKEAASESTSADFGDR
jgi:hypothetical protein